MPQPAASTTLIDSEQLTAWLLDGDEIALLDAREQGVYFDAHLFHAACVPLSSLELDLERLSPRRSTRMVWCDDGDTGLAERAATQAIALGYTNVSVLDGGTAAWSANGGELYSGVNVPSKAFGEYVEHTYGTPRLAAADLKALLDEERDVIVLDSRPIEEFRNMSIPTGTDCPGAELVHRIKEVVTDPETLVVVNCAGRTRSIIGTQSLINAGLENSVVALENGTMGWELAGFEVDHGREVHAPDPGAASQAWSTDAAAAVGDRFGVRIVDRATVIDWQADPLRTTYLLDVRTPGEFEEGHISGSRNAPGGQLVQATDECVATRNARIVLIDDNLVRATMTASWLRQLGWHDAVVLGDGVGVGGIDGGGLVRGGVGRVSVGPVATISTATLAAELAELDHDIAVLDVGTSLKYRKKGHIPGAYWGVRSRLDEARATVGDVSKLVVTSSDGQLAKLTVADAAMIWPDAEVVALAGGNKAWRHAGQPMEPGFTRPTTKPNDVWYKPYDHDDGEEVAAQHMVDYLTWEVALVAQLERDNTVAFPVFR